MLAFSTPMSYIVLIAAVGAALLAWRLRRVMRGRRRAWKFLIATLIVVLSVSSACLLFVFLLGHIFCARYELQSADSPDGRIVARVTEFDCGATTPFYSSVEIHQTHFALPHSAVWSHWTGTSVFWLEADPRFIEITWTGNRELTIRYPEPDHSPSFYQCNSSWHETQIRCEMYKPDERKTLSPLPRPNRWFW